MSKESIIRELPEAFVRQMRSWAATRSNVGVCPISPAYEGMPSTRVPGPRILAGQFGEPSMLEHAIDALKPRYSLAVRLFWLYEGNDLIWLGRRLGCDYRTVEERIRNGHNALRNDLANREARYERRQERAALA